MNPGYKKVKGPTLVGRARDCPGGGEDRAIDHRWRRGGDSRKDAGEKASNRHSDGGGSASLLFAGVVVQEVEARVEPAVCGDNRGSMSDGEV